MFSSFMHVICRCLFIFQTKDNKRYLRYNPYNPLTYIVLAILVVGSVVFNAIKEMENLDLFEWRDYEGQ